MRPSTIGGESTAARSYALRYLIIAAASTLVACGPKGASGSGGPGSSGSGTTDGAEGTTGPRILAELVEDTEAEGPDPLADSSEAIRSEIEAIKGGSFAKMPKATKKKTDVVADPVVTVRNLTRQPLTVWFSGECPRKITVPPDSRRRSVLCPGDYVTAARIDSPDIMPFLGDQLLEYGAQYTLSFFIAKKPTIERRKVKK